jgi:hypothetical protein
MLNSKRGFVIVFPLGNEAGDSVIEEGIEESSVLAAMVGRGCRQVAKWVSLSDVEALALMGHS